MMCELCCLSRSLGRSLMVTVFMVLLLHANEARASEKGKSPEEITSVLFEIESTNRPRSKYVWHRKLLFKRPFQFRLEEKFQGDVVRNEVCDGTSYYSFGLLPGTITKYDLKKLENA